jgi:acetyl esterase
MPLDPHLQGLLALIEAFGRPVLSASTPAAARQALRRLTVNMRLLDSTVPVGDVTDHLVRRTRGRLRVRVYRPPGRRSLHHPTIVFFHGGGFVVGDLDTHDNLCRWLCRGIDAVVVSVDYRVAPEDPFPAAVEDCLTATRWAADEVARLGRDANELVVAGDSAGGNLAAVVAQAWRDEIARGRPSLAAQLLIYPVVDLEDDDGARYPSRIQHADSYLLSSQDLRWFGEHYVGTFEDRRDPRLSPLYGELTDLPPAVIVTAEFDPLRDEGEAYAAALAAAGVRVEHRRFDGLIHGFFDLAALSPACGQAVQVTCTLLREMLEDAQDADGRR